MITKANAEFIVRAVNSHEALLEACREMVAALVDHVEKEAKSAGLSPDEVCPCATTTIARATQC